MADEEVPVSDDDLKSIAELAARQIAMEDWIERQEERLKEGKRKLAKITSEDLPDAMRAAGVKEFTLENGAELKLDMKVRASITKANEADAYEWLRENGGADIIRQKFELSFGASEDAQAEDFASKLEEEGLDYNQKVNVPWNSLDAFVRCELAENEHDENWEKMFGVYRQTSVKIIRPKA
jgi:hypothetical protein